MYGTFCCFCADDTLLGLGKMPMAHIAIGVGLSQDGLGFDSIEVSPIESLEEHTLIHYVTCIEA